MLAESTAAAAVPLVGAAVPVAAAPDVVSVAVRWVAEAMTRQE